MLVAGSNNASMVFAIPKFCPFSEVCACILQISSTIMIGLAIPV